jgi:hypothetical protein
MLCISVGGHKLPPYIIFNRKAVPRKGMFPKGVMCVHNKWMTTDLMDDGVKNVWERSHGSLRNLPNMLVLESFLGHLSEELKAELERRNCNVVVIPCCITSQLQSINVSVNKQFKDYLKKEYEAWLLSENLPLSLSAKIKRVSDSQLAEWVWPLEEDHRKNSGTVVQEILHYKCA